MVQLRPYQEEAIIAATNAFNKGTTGGVFNIFTGGGKTVISAMTIKRIFPPDKFRTIFVGGVNRSLVLQSDRELRKFIPELATQIRVGKRYYPGAGVVMGAIDQVNARVITASVQTLVDKTDSVKNNDPEAQPITSKDAYIDSEGNICISKTSKRRFLVSPRMDRILANGGQIHLWFHDEAHHAVADGSMIVIARLEQLYKALKLPPLKKIGNTATPIRADGKGLNSIFQRIFYSKSLMWAQENGYAVPFADPLRVTVQGVTIDSDTTVGEVNSIEVDNWTEVVVSTYQEKANNRHVIAYVGKIGNTGAIDASKQLAKAFNDAGIKAAHVDGELCIDPDGKELPIKDRGILLNAFQKGEIKVLCNFGVLIEGIDLPRCDAVFLLRKVNDLMFTQIIGRAIRLFPDKQDMLLVDFTSQDLIANCVASLMGYKVDPFTQEYKSDQGLIKAIDYILQVSGEEPERVVDWVHTQDRFEKNFATYVLSKSTLLAIAENVDEVEKRFTPIILACYRALSNEEDKVDIDIRDLRQGLNVYGAEKNYNLAEIVSKSSGDWYIDPHSMFMSLSVGEGEALVISPPNYTVAEQVKELVETLYEASLNEEFRKQHKDLQDKTTEQVTELYKRFEQTYEVISKFTLWHAFKNGRPKIVTAQTEIDAVELHAMDYVNELPNAVSSFSNKRSSWKRASNVAPVTEAQAKFLRNLLGLSEEQRLPSNSKVEAARLITHLLYATPIEKNINKILETFKN